MSSPLVRARAAAPGRPAADDACAGCPQLGTLRALRRAGLELQGAIGCDPCAGEPFVPAVGRWAGLTGVQSVLRRGAASLLDEAWQAGARLLVVADRVPAIRSTSLEDSLSRAGAPVVRLDLEDLAGTEARVRQALEAPGTVLLALAPCVRGARSAPPLAVDASRCNRCGGCLSLACPAIADLGGEAVTVDAEVCSGCGRCAPLCRSRALARTVER